MRLSPDAAARAAEPLASPGRRAGRAVPPRPAAGRSPASALCPPLPRQRATACAGAKPLLAQGRQHWRGPKMNAPATCRQEHVRWACNQSRKRTTDCSMRAVCVHSRGWSRPVYWAMARHAIASRNAYQQDSVSCGLFKKPKTAPVMPAKKPWPGSSACAVLCGGHIRP